MQYIVIKLWFIQRKSMKYINKPVQTQHRMYAYRQFQL